MLIGMLMDTFGDTLPASKLIFPMYYLSLLLVVNGFLKERSTPVLAGLGTLVLATMPVVVRHARVGYANLPLTFYLVIGVILFFRALSESFPKSQRVLWVVSGAFLALAIWTRPEGFGLVIGIMGAGLTWLFLSGELKHVRRVWLVSIIPLLVWVVWDVTSSRFYTGNLLVEGNFERLIQQLSSGIFHQGEFILILKLGEQLGLAFY